MTTDHVLFAFILFIFICLAGILFWIQRAQDHFARLDEEHRQMMDAAFRRYEAHQATPPKERPRG